eukprot:CAMPEP_0113493502 /NCGR_PEP_ID=MMETSP0014_2-20120614/28624_1 /TAXON_ID=2857 /ORGANISM="Nitzschia sp." /LENGTH=360 /DNA_ID=CAMNT_0000387365 /DNA_START=52 /DNA_END=1134 /DNA_ORIENTATION=+ /assembly_acc=CAM_ASM_000159
MTSTTSATIPSTMKAAVIHKVGREDFPNEQYLSVDADVDVPEPSQGEILIKVSAASINPIDWKLANGSVPGRKPGPLYGFDVSGTVVKLGPETTGSTTLKVGDEVYADVAQTGSKSGSFAEYCLCQVAAAFPKPKNTNFVEAASLPLVGLTALQGLTTQGGFQEGQGQNIRILIFGGTSAVGSLAIQIAKAMGASEVYSTGSDVDKIKSFGADHVVNYKEQNLMDALKGQDFDLVYDTIGGYEHWNVGHAALKKGGGSTFVTIAGDITPTTGLPGYLLKVAWRKLVSYFGQPTYRFFLTDTTAPGVVESMTKLTELVESGKVKPFLDGRTFELTTEGLLGISKASMSGRAKGKLIMKIDC